MVEILDRFKSELKSMDDALSKEDWDINKGFLKERIEKGSYKLGMRNSLFDVISSLEQDIETFLYDLGYACTVENRIGECDHGTYCFKCKLFKKR